MGEEKWYLAKTSLIVFTIINILLFLAYIIIGFVVFAGSSCTKNEELFGKGLGKVSTYSQKVVYNFLTKQLNVYDDKGENVFSASVAGRINFDDYTKLAVSRPEGESTKNDYLFKFTSKSTSIANLEFVMQNSNRKSVDQKLDEEITCDTFEWRVIEPDGVTSYAPQEFEECFNLAGASWYGQTESRLQQYWPINDMSWNEYRPYLSGFIDEWGSILERYWLSSSGVALIVDRSVPLFVRKNNQSVCLLASASSPYDEKRRAVNLKYDLCRIEKSGSEKDFLNKLQVYVMNNYFTKPIGIPDERMFKSPIWSTWAFFKANINESIIKDYAEQIIVNGYPHSQIEIDDKWSSRYGDFEFDKIKFPDITAFITELNALGFRTTLWMHPFTNIDSPNFQIISDASHAVHNRDADTPGLMSWWQGRLALILDATNPDACDWFVESLEAIRRDAKIDSFKFDAGEINWLPKNFQLNNSKSTPDEYCSSYARLSARFGSLIEVRVGCGTQDLPIFVRMLDKESTWGYDNGLKSVLTTALTMSILGYPFILPDMIGGNAYGENIDLTGLAYPEYELYVRWAQLTAFMPSMQFSIPPWYYNDKTTVPVNDICKKYVDLHEVLIHPLIMKYANISTVTGEPIIRPIWWIDNSDKTTQQISDEFLIGNEILVAPVMDEKVINRDIYLPEGRWRDEKGVKYDGPTWLQDYPAPIESIPYFISIDSD